MMREICLHLGAERVAVLTSVVEAAEETQLDTVRVYRFEGARPPRSTMEAVRSIALLGYAITRERPSVLQFATLSDAYLAYWARRAFRKKYIFYAHGNELLRAAESPWEKTSSALMGATCVVANSRYTAKLVRDLGYPGDRIRIVHPGCDVTQFRPVPPDREARARFLRGHIAARVLLTVGNLVERKGHDIVIRALALMSPSFRDVIYLVAGDGPFRGELEQLARSLGVADRVFFLGRVPTSDLPLLYSLANVFIMVARERSEHCDVEGFGIVFIEAAACGLPAIAGRSGGMEDAVLDGKTGVVVDPNDAAKVARAIETLLGNPELTHRLGDAARKRALHDFTWARYGEAVASILTEVGEG
jgi:phosphatidylinositol alpha-1,6-mannosyltransferase